MPECTLHKDPNSDLDFQKNWAAWLTGGEAISSSVWSVTGPDAALVLGTQTNDTDSATAWVSGGTVGK